MCDIGLYMGGLFGKELRDESGPVPGLTPSEIREERNPVLVPVPMSAAKRRKRVTIRPSGWLPDYLLQQVGR